jgi:dimethylhistidine N-methyltransferase
MKPEPVKLHDYAPSTERMLEDVLRGLRATQKEVPCKYFYDERGSDLFEQICNLDEYYLTRAELEIMDRHAGEMAAALGPRCLVIEYGSGSGRKTRLLLEQMDSPAAYVPIDISGEALLRTAKELASGFPGLEVLPVCADYTQPFEMPRSGAPARRRVVYYPGSTIGNFSPRDARSFLRHAGEVAGENGGLLIGVDLRKDPSILEAAYDDSRGITAKFNMNLLARFNDELDADFALDSFSHRALYNEDLGRVEMHLVSEKAQDVRIAGERVSFRQGETIHTESCYKYDVGGFASLASSAGLQVVTVWTDRRRLFSVQYLVGF